MQDFDAPTGRSSVSLNLLAPAFGEAPTRGSSEAAELAAESGMLTMQEMPGRSVSVPKQAFVERRLVAILAADVVGFSRMIGEDEVGAVERLRELRGKIVEPLIAEQSGRIFKLMGDGMLAEFPSAVLALRAAIGIQDSLKDRNAGAPAGQLLELRMAVHQGDVIVENSDLLGDGVNIAARLETLAEPGRISCDSPTGHMVIAGEPVAVAADTLGDGEPALLRRCKVRKSDCRLVTSGTCAATIGPKIHVSQFDDASARRSVSSHPD